MSLGDYTNEERRAVRELGDRIGYGRVMQLASEIWQLKASNEGREGEGLAVGPHIGVTVPCGCTSKCDWCGSAGWLTVRASNARDQLIEARRLLEAVLEVTDEELVAIDKELNKRNTPFRIRAFLDILGREEDL